MEPSSDLIEMCARCDQLFEEFHGNGIRSCYNPLEKIQSSISKSNPTFPPRIVELFCKVKFYSRIKQLNINMKIKKHNKSVRALKQNAQFLN